MTKEWIVAGPLSADPQDNPDTDPQPDTGDKNPKTLDKDPVPPKKR